MFTVYLVKSNIVPGGWVYQKEEVRHNDVVVHTLEIENYDTALHHLLEVRLLNESLCHLYAQNGLLYT